MKSIKYLAISIVTFSMALSCVDKNYDWSKLDKTVHIDADLEIGLGCTEEIKIGDLIGENAGDILSVNDRGDYCIKIKDSIRINEEETNKANTKYNAHALKAKVNIDATIKYYPENIIMLPEMPDFLRVTNLDIYDYVVILDIKNETGLAPEIDIDFKAYSYTNDDDTQEKTLHIGANGPDGDILEHLIIPDYGGKVFISQQGKYASEHQQEGTDIQFDIEHLFNPIPYQFEVVMAAFRLEIIQWDPSAIATLPEMVGLVYTIEVPLAFGKNLNISYQYRLKNLGEQLQVLWDKATDFNIETLEISCNIENALPLGIAIAATPLDKDGNPIENLSIDLPDSVMPGTIAGASNNPFRIKVSGDMETLKKLDALDLSLTFSCSEEAEGIPLNENQWVKISDLKANLNANVDADISNI